MGAQDEQPNKRIKVDSSPFAPSLLSLESTKKLAADYETSAPYQHAVIHELFVPDFLNQAREEIVQHVRFTEKETDICTFPSDPFLLRANFPSCLPIDKVRHSLVADTCGKCAYSFEPADLPNWRLDEPLRSPRCRTRPLPNSPLTPRLSLFLGVPQFRFKSDEMWSLEWLEDGHELRGLFEGELFVES